MCGTCGEIDEKEASERPCEVGKEPYQVYILRWAWFWVSQLATSSLARGALETIAQRWDFAPSLDPTLLPALKGRAVALFHLKRVSTGHRGL